MRHLWVGLHTVSITDYGVGEPPSGMMFLCWVPVCRYFVRCVGRDMLPPPPTSAYLTMRSWTYLLGFPKYHWPPILVITKDSYGNLYHREPENVDCIGREIKSGPMSD